MSIDRQLLKLVEMAKEREEKRKVEELHKLPNEYKRYKRYMASWCFFEALFKEGVRTSFNIIDGLPEDAKLVHIYLENEKCQIGFIFEHESFPEVRVGSIIPIYTITLEAISEKV